MDANPFHPPTSTEPARRSPGRTVLACVIGIMGAAMIVGNGLFLAYRILIESWIPWSAVPWSFAIWEIEVRVVGMILGFIWIWSSVWIFRDKWRAGLSIAAINCVLVMANDEISTELRREFAGTQYTTEIPDGRGGADPVTVRIP